MAHNTIALRIARIAAVLVALSVLGYLAYEAQGRANPPAQAGAKPNADSKSEEGSLPESGTVGDLTAPAGFEGTPVEVPPADQVVPDSLRRRTFIGSSKSLPIHVDLPEVEVEEGTFLYGSKSGIVRLPPLDPPVVEDELESQPDSID